MTKLVLLLLSLLLGIFGNTFFQAPARSGEILQAELIHQANEKASRQAAAAAEEASRQAAAAAEEASRQAAAAAEEAFRQTAANETLPAAEESSAAETALSYQQIQSYTVQVLGLNKMEGEMIPYSLELEFADGALLALPCFENLSYLQEGDVVLLEQIDVQQAGETISVWVVDGHCVEEPDWRFPE